MTTKTDEQERTLLPCPFCGGNPSISKQMDESLWSHNIVLWTGVQCDECEAQVGPTCEGFEVEAVDMWNRRAALQSQDLEDTFCVWHNDPETDNSWDTSCRQLFEIYDGTPTENSMTFCCYCGKPIRESIDHVSSTEEK